MNLPPVIESYRDEYVIHLSSRSISPETFRSYTSNLNHFLTWLTRTHPRVAEPTDIRQIICTEYLAAVRARGLKDSSIRARGLAVQLWFKYLCGQPDILEVTQNPMDTIELPKPQPPRVEIVRTEAIKAIVGTCERGTFVGSRDEAVIRLLFDCGLRRFEAAGILLEKLDIKRREVTVLGKGARGGKWRVATFSATTAMALTKYLRLRARHRAAHEPHLFLSTRVSAVTGDHALTGSGIYAALDKRRVKAGIEERIWPHRIRHTWAHGMKEDGATDEVLEIQGGWVPGSKEARRYGASVAEQRALGAARGLTRGDRI